MAGLRAGDLTVDTAEEANAIRLVFRGRSNERRPGEVLGPFLSEQLATAAGRNLPLELDFAGVSHMNSSTIGCVVRLIREAQERAVPLVLSYDAAIQWQKLTFEALRVFERAGAVSIARSR
jgi:hypothetical protein